jgi:hypothetical protein
MLLAFLPFTAPPIIWNAQHDWITLAHSVARGGLEKAFRIDLAEFFTFIGQHFGAYSPLLFAAVLVGGGGGCKSAPLFQGAVPPRIRAAALGDVLWLALRQAGEANWTAPSHGFAGNPRRRCWHERAQTSTASRRTAIAALALGMLMSVLALNTDLLRAAGIPLSYEIDPSKAAPRLAQLGRAAGEKCAPPLRQQHGQPVFLIANSYGTAANLGFYLHDKRREGPLHPPLYFPDRPRSRTVLLLAALR